MTATVLWKPRPSAIGGYLECDYRAAYDRAIAEDPQILFQMSQETQASVGSASPYADLGTCIHFHLQDGLRCEFPGGDPLPHAPTPEQRLNAAKLFNNDLTILDQKIRESATLAAHHLPKPADGRPWLAEGEFPDPAKLTKAGHIDFLSQDWTELWDLKTTSKPPAHMRVKPAHLHQLLTYRRCAKNKPRRGGILYVDSLRASWALAVPIDFESEAMLELGEHTVEYTKFLRSSQLAKRAVPRMGTHCSENFCPYVADCKNRFIPPSNKIHESSPLVAPTTSFTV